MKRYVHLIAGLVLLAPQMASAQSDYGRRGGNYDNRPYASGYARDTRDCQSDQQNKQMTNAAIGAAAGGLLGNQVAGRGSRTGGTIAGVLLGAVAGYALTHDVDCNDRNYAEPTYSRGLEGPVGQRYNWRNDNDRDRGTFTPTRQYQRDQYTCRDYNTTTYRGSRSTRRNGSACRYEDGNWYFQ
jgi:surface antigen